MVSMIETAADKAAGKVVLAQSSSRALVLARVCETTAEGSLKKKDNEKVVDTECILYSFLLHILC